MRRPVVVHPLLVAAFPALFVCAQNVQQFTPDSMALPLLILLGSGAALWGVAGLLTRDARKSALITSLFFLLFFSYTVAWGLLPQFTWVVAGGTIGPRKLTFAAWTLLFLGGSWLAQRTRRDLAKLTKVLNVAALALVLIPAFNIAWYEARYRTHASIEATDDDAGGSIVVASPPDIYLIIMDAYARDDVLRDIYGLDNRDFTDWLRQKGFYVADRSATNYPSTHLAVPTVLQMDYVDRYLPPVDRNTCTDLHLMTQFANHSALERFLRRRGYTIVAFQSGCPTTEMKSADVFLKPGWFYDEFSNALIDMTPLGVFFNSRDHGDGRRRHLLFMFRALESMVSRPGPKFVMAHFPGPHRPFVFGPHGEPVNPPNVNTPGHDVPRGDEVAEYQRFYRDEVVFLNAKLRATLDVLLTKSARPPIIVLQSDHGPMSLWGDLPRWGDALYRERFGILNACYLAGSTDNALYPGITPVNSFRIVLNHVFGARFPMLPDRSYMTRETPYKFLDVTDRVRREQPGTRAPQNAP